jgi:ADP-dependent NAD(P)H-hydrate dehydratase
MGAEPTTVTPATLQSWPLPQPGRDKASRGRLSVLGGSTTTPGAVILAGEAALRAGAGKLGVATARPAAQAVAVASPEAMVLGLPTGRDGCIAVGGAEEVLAFADGSDAFLVGPGFIDTVASVRLLRGVLPEWDGPAVVDALGSAYLTEHPEGLHHLDGQAVLTVNPTELSRTARHEEAKVEADPYDAARAVAERSRVVVLCGGREKLVVTPEGDSWLVPGGGPGLGVSGSGDVQAGIVAGLLARGAEPAQAAVWGACLHVRAGERLAAAVGPVGYLARELPRQIPPILAASG